MAIHFIPLAAGFALRWAARRLAGRGAAAAVGGVAGAAASQMTASFAPGAKGRQLMRAAPPARARPGSRLRGLTGGSRPDPANPTVHLDQKDALTRLWTWDAASNLLEKMTGFFKGNLPNFAHAIVVTCEGGPQADLRRVYYLALAAAFGKYRDGLRGSIGESTLNCTWDITGKAVQIEIGYTASAFVEGARAVVRNVTGGDSALRVITQGPTQVTVGGGWPTFLTNTFGQNSTTGLGKWSVLGGALAGGALAAIVKTERAKVVIGSDQPAAPVKSGASPDLTAVPCGGDPVAGTVATGSTVVDIYKELSRPGGSGETLHPWGKIVPGTDNATDYGSVVTDKFPLPGLPDRGRVITTGEKNDPRVQPPRPSLDGSTRSSLLSLVAQALSSPCFLPAPPPCTSVPALSTGVFPSFNVYTQTMNGKVVVVTEPDLGTAPGNGFFGRIGRALFGPDGYRRPKVASPNVKG